MLRLFIVSCFLCFTIAAFAQEMSYGFKAGLNFNSFIGDSEQDAAGKSLESFSGNTGFHVGASFTWKATELMGLRAELIFSQKGGRQRYEGPSYYQYKSTDGATLEATGLRNMRVNVTNAYIDIPLMGYFKPFQWLELYAGGNIGFLVSSQAVGDLMFTPDENNFPTVDYSLDFNYYSDDPGGATPSGDVVLINNNFEMAVLEQAGAYAEFDKDRGNLYKTIDLGLIGGLSLYFNKGLYISGRVNYGLTDVTKSEADVSLVKKDANGQFIAQNSKDRNFSIQASIGFSF